MGHYRSEMCCDNCGKLYGCDCYEKKQIKREEQESDKLLNILDKSEIKFINIISSNVLKELKEYNRKGFYFFTKDEGWVSLHSFIKK